jgi:hypothetical protein
MLKKGDLDASRFHTVGFGWRFLVKKAASLNVDAFFAKNNDLPQDGNMEPQKVLKISSSSLNIN